MNTLLIFIWIFLAMIAMSFWEAYSEGRKAWDKGKIGWKLKIGKNFVLPAYHFYLFVIMLPVFFTLPLIIYGWNLRLFGILFSAYFLGVIIEVFFWYIVNPEVKFREFFTGFSDYYPWLKIKGKKSIPLFYLSYLLIAGLSWYFLWR